MTVQSSLGVTGLPQQGSVSVRSLTNVWFGKTFSCLVLGSDFDERHSQKAAGPFRDDFCTISKETPEAREVGVSSLAQQQELFGLGVLPGTPFRIGSLGLGCVLQVSWEWAPHIPVAPFNT